MDNGNINSNAKVKKVLGRAIPPTLLLLIVTGAWGMHEKVECTVCHSYLSDALAAYSIGDAGFSKSQICLSCHDAGVGLSRRNPPFVLNGQSDLAGGSFTSTLASDQTGHNIQSEDKILGITPPGGSPGEKLNCLSCHDPHSNGNFRNLKMEINGRPTRIQAVGDPDYRANVYISGINEFCGACHFQFYDGAGTADVFGYRRHPVGITISGAANADIEWWAKLESRVTRVEYPSGNPDDVYAARVFCLSCHQAHASPYDNALRWDYGSDPRGCLECHTF